MKKWGRCRSLTLGVLAVIGVLACNLYSGSRPATSEPPGEIVESSSSNAPSETPPLPSLTPTLPSETPTLPSETPTVPSETPTIPTATFTVPTSTPTVPTSTATSKLFILPPKLLPIKPLPLLPLSPSKLDYTASANYGEANLAGGFSPDPYSVGMTTGGKVDVSYLGGNCSGFASVAPDLRVNFSGGGAALLRIYFFASSGDPAMVINDPYGNFYCVDDSFGTTNPTIDFNNPAGGTYDFWIGAPSSGSNVSGTMYITENSGNHP